MRLRKIKRFGQILTIAALIGLGACHHHHHSGPDPAPGAGNPAAYSYTATEVAHHQPGFFSCINMGGLFTGSYMDYNHKHDMQAQLGKLEGNHIRVLHVVKGSESIYNLARLDANSIFLPCEQGPLLGSSLSGHVWMIHPKHLGMGHYWVGWWNGKWVTTEKDTISTQNKSQVWIGDNLLYQTSEYTWKEGVIQGDYLYLASYFIHKRTEGGLLKVNLRTGQASLIYSQRWTSCYAVGYNNLAGLVYSLQHGESATLRTLNGPFQELPHIPWRIFPKGLPFMTAADHGWRKGGPSYLYVWDTQKHKFVLKLQLKDAEPWDMARGPDENSYYLVTRNEKEGNLGRVYLIRRQ